MVNKFRIPAVLAVSILVGSLIVVLGLSGRIQHGDEGFGVKEYGDFHRVLHELQHEALPNRDFARLRAKAAELVKLGHAIVQLGVPRGTSEAKVEEFRRELKKFDNALSKYGADAKAGTDDELKGSFSSVHDSFETLADMLPRK
jgi:hypothetical protein